MQLLVNIFTVGLLINSVSWASSSKSVSAPPRTESVQKWVDAYKSGASLKEDDNTYPMSISGRDLNCTVMKIGLDPIKPGDKRPIEDFTVTSQGCDSPDRFLSCGISSRAPTAYSDKWVGWDRSNRGDPPFFSDQYFDLCAWYETKILSAITFMAAVKEPGSNTGIGIGLYQDVSRLIRCTAK